MRFFFSFAIASIILLLLNSSTNARPFGDEEIHKLVEGSVYKAEQMAEGNNNKLTVVFPKSKRDISGILNPVEDGDIVGGDNQFEDIENAAKSKREVKYAKTEVVIINGKMYYVNQAAHGDGIKQTVVFHKTKREIEDVVKPVAEE